jgi:hypothetical protein
VFAVRPEYPNFIGIDAIHFNPILCPGTDAKSHARSGSVLLKSGSDAIRTGSQFDRQRELSDILSKQGFVEFLGS